MQCVVWARSGRSVFEGAPIAVLLQIRGQNRKRRRRRSSSKMEGVLFYIRIFSVFLFLLLWWIRHSQALNSFFSRKVHGTAAHWISYIAHNGWNRGADGVTRTGWNKYRSFRSRLFIPPGTAAVIEVDFMENTLSVTNCKGVTISVTLYQMERCRLAFELGNCPSSLTVVGHWWKQRNHKHSKRWWNMGPICDFLSI